MGGEPTFVADRRPRRAPNGTPTRSARPSAASPPSWCTSCAPNTARAASCISARASGTRASSCRAGRCRSSGAPTASRAGTSPTLFADERQPHALHERRRAALHQRAGAQAGPRPTSFVQPGYEDVCYYLWRERRLPVNVDPFDSRLDDEMERVRLRRVFTQKLDAVVGYVLPLRGRERRRRCARARRPGVGHRPLVPARRTHVPDPRRFADGLPPAARFAALGQQGRLSLPGRARPDRAARTAARVRHLPRALRRRARRRAGRSRRRALRLRRAAAVAGRAALPGRARQPGGSARGSGLPPIRPGPPAAPRRVGALDHAHRAVRGSARPAPRQRAEGREGRQRQSGVLYVFMPPLARAGGLPRPARRGRGHGRSSWA